MRARAISRRFDSFAGTPEDDNHYHISVPTFDRATASRSSLDLATVVAHEALVEELHRTPDMQTRLRQMVERRELPPCYLRNRFVMEAPEASIVPLTLYVDGISYTARDNLIAWHIHNMVTDQRHFLVGIRSHDLCRCGCKGWDSTLGIHLYLKWTLSALLHGRWPDTRHDGSEWQEADGFRKVLAGSLLGVRACVVMIKSDCSCACFICVFKILLIVLTLLLGF